MTQQHREEPGVVEDKKEVAGTTVPSLSATPKVDVKQLKQGDDLKDGLTVEERQELDRLAQDEVKRYIAAKGSEELEQEDKLANVGLKAQRETSSTSASDLQLLQERMGRLIGDKSSPSSKVMADLQELEAALDRINPNAIDKQLWYQILGSLPFLGSRLIRALRKAARSRQSVADFINYIETSLRAGRETLNLDNAQLKVLYKKVEGFQVVVRRNAYLAWTLLEKLEAEIKETQDPVKKSRLQNVLFRVSVRYQDLRAMEEVYEQAFASITIIRESNSLLMGSIDRMLTLGMQVVYVAFAIAVALAHQKDALEGYKKTRDFIGNLIAANAEAIAKHVREIGDIYKEPVIAMKKIEEAHANVLQAMDEIDKLKVVGVAIAKENGEKLRKMAEEMRNRSNAAQVAETVSLETSDLPTRPAGQGERPKL